VEVLRAQRRYDEAIELLRRPHGRSWDPHTAEVLSLEEGDLLDRAGDSARACADWRAHARQFPTGTYREAVTEALSRPRCR
jgi:predicted negative regulator of RcsB-dependent stress response